MTVTTNAANLGQYKFRFSLIVEQILAFTSSFNMVREAKKICSNFEQIEGRYFVLMNIGKVRSILLLNSK